MTHLLHLLFPALILGLSAFADETADVCPKTSIKPCACKTYYDGSCIITCGLASQKDLQRLADVPNLCNGHVHFMLVNSKVDGIPAKLWNTLLSSKTVDVAIKHTRVGGIVPPGGDSIPKVYTSGTAAIKLDHAKVGQWDWKQLSNFYSEEDLTLVIDDTPLSELGSDFGSIANGRVHKITIDNTGLNSIQENQFAGFTDLSSLSLQNNKLTSVSRALIAKPANKLQFLHLNGNSLTTLPGDLFSEMPVLEVVYLRDNNIKYLPQEIFQSLSSKVQRIDLVRNPWECNCKLAWILKNTKVFVNFGDCASPESLAGKKVRNLPELLEC
ncbi:hypothetical protein JTE90_020721 [Oedothorax gibbosus]|uniref:Uncharacterized protein n=1 Tax=Oedothorax gibbosus TaxID=931172 RepID=A0AAV6V3X0_9ARAC|nr:hypothetical protein JTE90_020721 [Oedothorax gibbosus]